MLKGNDASTDRPERCLNLFFHLRFILLIHPQPRRKASECFIVKRNISVSRVLSGGVSQRAALSIVSCIVRRTGSSISAPLGAEKKDQCAREAVNNYLSIEEEPQLISHPGGQDAPLLPLDTSRLQPSASLFNFLPTEQEASARNVL